MILKDKFLFQCTSDIRIKLQQLQQQDSAASIEEMVQRATNPFYNREQDKKAKAQQREKRKETGHAQMLASPPGKPYGKPQVLEGQGLRHA